VIYRLEDQQRDRQAGKRPGRLTSKQTNDQIDKESNGQIDRPAGRQKYRYTERDLEKES
jgi:hypothetical protein